MEERKLNFIAAKGAVAKKWHLAISITKRSRGVVTLLDMPLTYFNTCVLYSWHQVGYKAKLIFKSYLDLPAPPRSK